MKSKRFLKTMRGNRLFCLTRVVLTEKRQENYVVANEALRVKQSRFESGLRK